ncbi:hypothetical protein TNCV_3598661 [Trichonephila clavipes]|nr:hypothetical protein TNCV_3598661 [Trichonephila clavipes]
MASSVSRYDSSRLLAVGILKFPESPHPNVRVLIPSIESVGIEKCDPPRVVMYTGRHSAICRCWVYDTLGMYHPLWWWIWGPMLL